MKSVTKINEVKGYDKFVERKQANFFYNKFWMEFLEGNENSQIYFYTEEGNGIKSFLGLSSEGKDYYGVPQWVSEKVFIEGDLLKFIRKFKGLDADAVVLDNISEEQGKTLEKSGFITYPSYVYPELRISSIDGFWGGLENSGKRKNLRRVLRKAEEEGLEIVRVSSEEDLKGYFFLEEETMKRNNAVAEPLRYWREIYEKVPEEKLLFLLVRKGEEVIAGRISFVDENKIFNWRGVSLKKFQEYHANELLHFYIIEEAVRRGISLIDYGTSSISKSGSYVFKKKFANGERFLWSAVYPLNEKSKEKYLNIARENIAKLNAFLGER